MANRLDRGRNIMNIYKKLQSCRTKLQATKLNKSGHNKFAGYKYFELGDFLPSIQTLFDEAGLCGVVSFNSDLTTLTIYDTDSEAQIVFTSPMAEASLKGCHPIQNLGAVQTYQRRYLWITAMEIVENDALDAVTGSEPIKAAKKTITPESGTAWENAKAAFRRDGNLDAVLARVNISESDQGKLYEECDSV